MFLSQLEQTMTKEFLQPPLTLKPKGAPESAYLKARQEWDDRLGSARVQASNWRLGFMGLLAIALLLTGLNIYQTTRNTVIPFVIEVSKDSGAARVVGKVGEIDYVPQKLQIQYFLRNFVRNIREIPADPVVIKQRWLNAYYFLQKEAATLLDQLANEENSPLAKIGEIRVTVQPLTVNQVGSGKSYQVRWKEKVYDSTGNFMNEYTMSGVFSLTFSPPKTEEDVNNNPLGIYIRSFSWSKEL